MRIHEVLLEILEQYSQEYRKNNKANNPYYKAFKQHIENAFKPLLYKGFAILLRERID